MRIALAVLLALVAFLIAPGNSLIYHDQATLAQAHAWFDLPANAGDAANYAPVSLLFLRLEQRLFGDTPAPFHLVSLLLHALATFLCLRIFSQLLGENAGFATALLFATHPAHSEAVLPVYGQPDLLAAVLCLAAIDRYLAQRDHADRLYSLAACFLAPLAAPAAIVAPLLILLVAWFHDPQKKSWRMESLYAIPLALYLGLRVFVLEIPLAAPPIDLGARFLIIAISNYLRLWIVPWGLTVYHSELPRRLLNWPYEEALWILLVVIGAVLLARLNLKRTVIFAFGWWLIALLPALFLLPAPGVISERALYLPSMGLAAASGAGLALLISRPVVWRTALASLLVIFCVMSLRVTHTWRDDESLWRKTVADYPDVPLPPAALGMTLLAPALAAGHVDPADPRFEEAKESFASALWLDPKSAEGLYGAGLIDSLSGNCASARMFFEEAAKFRPPDAQIARAMERCSP